MNTYPSYACGTSNNYASMNTNQQSMNFPQSNMPHFSGINTNMPMQFTNQMSSQWMQNQNQNQIQSYNYPINMPTMSPIPCQQNPILQNLPTTTDFYDPSTMVLPDSEVFNEPYIQNIPVPIAPQNSNLFVTTEIMKQYLANRDAYTCTLTIKIPITVTKSYKDEKRYLAPGPIVSLIGFGWTNNKLSGIGIRETPNVSITFDGIDEEPNHLDSLSCHTSGMHFQTKTLYVESSVSNVALITDVKFGTNWSLGSILSPDLMIMSKPSKRKQMALRKDDKSNSQWVPNGGRIALYNRQTPMNTRYFLAGEDGAIHSSQNDWSILEIYVVKAFDNDNEASQQMECNDNGTVCDAVDKDYVQYGDTVVLLDVATKTSLCPAVIRKIDRINGKSAVSSATGDLVSQMHIVVFEFNDETGKPVYLTANPYRLKVQEIGFQMKNSTIKSELTKWTIVNANYTKCSFAPMLRVPMQPIAPFPNIDCVRIDGIHEFIINGININSDFTVWIGALKADYVNHLFLGDVCRLRCEIPSVETYCLHHQPQETLPLNLIRSDGVIYPTDYHFILHYEQKIFRIVHTDELGDPALGVLNCY